MKGIPIKRILLVVAIVIGTLVVALAAAPFWLGMQTEAAFKEVMKIASARGGAPAKSTEYSRGWISSTARDSFSLPGSPLTLDAEHRIEHGPFPLSQLMVGQIVPSLARIESTFRFVADKKASQELVRIVNLLPPVSVVTTLDLSGGGTSEIAVAGDSRKIGKENLTWTAAKGSMRFDKELKNIRTDFMLPSVVYQSTQGALNFKGISLDSDMHEGPAKYMFGRNSVSITQISMKPFLDISGLRIGASVQPTGRFANITVNYSLKKMTLAKDTYGPGNLDIVIRNLDATILKQLEDELNKIYARGLPEEQAQLMIAGKLMEYAGKLTRDDPEIEVTKLSFTAPGGELKGAARFVIQGKDQDLSANPMLVLTAIRGTAELSMPDSLAKAMVMPQIQRDLLLLQQEGKLDNTEAGKLTPETIDKIAEEAYPGYLKESVFGRWFVRENSNYRFGMSIDRGQVVINGIPITGGNR